MKSRPVSVTVVAWIIIATNGLSLVTVTLGLNNPTAIELMNRSPLPVPVQLGIAYFSLLALLVCGVAMLKGRKWARSLYVIISIAGVLIGIATSPVKLLLIPGFIIFVIFVFFLFRPKANEFFHSHA